MLCSSTCSAGVIVVCAGSHGEASGRAAGFAPVSGWVQVLVASSPAGGRARDQRALLPGGRANGAPRLERCHASGRQAGCSPVVRSTAAPVWAGPWQPAVAGQGAGRAELGRLASHSGTGTCGLKRLCDAISPPTIAHRRCRDLPRMAPNAATVAYRTTPPTRTGQPTG